MTTTTTSPPPPPRPHFSSIDSEPEPKVPVPSPLSKQSRETTANSLVSSKLRSNLMREHKERDPLFFYEVVQTLGVGSMGSVAKVRKRQQRVGGSARKDIQDAVREQKRRKECLKIPIIGGLFRFCIDDGLTLKEPKKGKFVNLSNPAKYLEATGNINHRHEDSSVLLPSMEAISADARISSHSYFDNTMNDSARSFGTYSTHQSSSVASIEYAMKSIHLSRVTDDTFVTELKNEIAILKQLDHPYIVRPIETFEHRNQIFIVMELCSGGDLYSRDPYTEEEAARIVSSILSAIAYMHSRNIAHRDLKYENILFSSASPTAEIKLIDFGLSKIYGDDLQLTEGVGTVYTMAPEVLKGSYTRKADIWSIGVITYMLLSSQMPFYGRKRRHIIEQILNCQYDFRGRRWKRISQQAKNFIEELLVFDQDERIDATTALSLTWLNKRFAATTRGPQKEEETMARQAMLRYAGYTKLKRMALMVVAHKSTSAEIGILRKVFQKYDKRQDGCITFDQFCEALKESGHSTNDMKEMFEAVDLDGTGRIRYTEFLAATIEAQGAISEERLAECFDRLDADDSGFISAENLAELLGDDFPKDEIAEIIKEADIGGDGKVSYAEFLSLWEQKHEEERANALQMLGDPALPSSLSILTISDSNNSKNSENSASISHGEDSEEREAAKARASFVIEKHSPGIKHVAFEETVIAIQADECSQQLSFDDDPVYA
ncbi:serine:threonine protein kinase [Nitzschia inconspicua]|uniref:Serine:threonine protein kinase n=1 Tax=Nitzschia inconspicua TaxID=303405 RepID=A0A9K3L3U1_9STRA|nr:serine:threonine protein kinase [Nitzschia inconspicua]